MTAELAWAAGFFDGEGCTTMQRRENGRPSAANVAISQAADLTDDGPVDGPPHVLVRFNAVMGDRGKLRMTRDGKRSMWTLRFDGYARSIAVLCRLWPWLSPMKQQQAHRIMKEYLSSRTQFGSRGGWRCPNGHIKTGRTARGGCRTCAEEASRRAYVPHPRETKLQCLRGHEYTPENTYMYDGIQYCRTCNRESHARKKAS